MRTPTLLAALPIAFALAACSDPGGEDTADMAPDAVAPGPAGMSEDTANETDPMDDAIMADDTMTGEPMADEPAQTTEPTDGEM